MEGGKGERLMRGSTDPQATMPALADLDERVPHARPSWTIDILADRALEWLSPEFDRMYSKVGGASGTPERLLKASLLISPYSERSFDPTVFTSVSHSLIPLAVNSGPNPSRCSLAVPLLPSAPPASRSHPRT